MVAWFGGENLRELAKVTGELAQGNLAARVQVAGDDEYAEIKKNLNAFASNIQTLVSELSHDKAHLATILSNMTEGVVAINSKGVILVINPALAQLFEVQDIAQVQGKLLLEVMRQSQLNSLLQKVLEEQKPVTEEIRTFSPEERVFEAHAVPLMEKEQCTGALLVLHDISRIRRLEQVRRDFVANVSHELRTPLASIKGFAETLLTGAMNDPKVAMGFLRSIDKHIDNMTALVEDLLDLTAIESGQRMPARERLALADIIPELIKSLNPIAHRKNVTVSCDLDPSLPLIYMDRGHLKQVVTNLIENAVKFNHEGGWVKLTADLKDDAVALNVADSGAGIPSQDLPRVFERFYRVDKARARAMGGTGLGLSIVKHLVEANGGTVTVESAVGKGSTFTLLLPA